ncbi:DUF3549 family protein [Ferrimonas marina]|uniref:DUF3549 domain-containing protein n=1 Tax=Ferrimonas marina TaxID=299255 RepID=A0A1M5YFQ4_9GAMM|nr:DUF3549 family protein [Ferrimonas marina]SHI10891.1 Protein of unknown function [Ferrimonas marina]
MDTITTLDQFLTQAGTQYQVYDLGRRVVPLDRPLFGQIESGHQPYPFPRAGHAWLGLLFWNPQLSAQHYVWFLKLPLDERGLINPAARNQFLQMVVEALGQDPAAPLSEEQQERLNNNPFTFTPSQEKMAMFHARVRGLLAQPASVHFESVQHYLLGQRPWDQWQQLGLQGFADMACRLTAQEEADVVTAIEKMPMAPLQAWASMQEHTSVSDALAQAWLQRAGRCDDDASERLCLRALAGNPQYCRQGVDLLLAKSDLDPEALIAIAARMWHGLDEQRVGLMLEKMALHPSQLFNQLYLDLVAIPALRPAVLAKMRDPQRSPALAQAIGRLMTALRG